MRYFRYFHNQPSSLKTITSLTIYFAFVTCTKAIVIDYNFTTFSIDNSNPLTAANRKPLILKNSQNQLDSKPSSQHDLEQISQVGSKVPNKSELESLSQHNLQNVSSQLDQHNLENISSHTDQHNLEKSEGQLDQHNLENFSSQLDDYNLKKSSSQLDPTSENSKIHKKSQNDSSSPQISPDNLNNTSALFNNNNQITKKSDVDSPQVTSMSQTSATKKLNLSIKESTGNSEIKKQSKANEMSTSGSGGNGKAIAICVMFGAVVILMSCALYVKQRQVRGDDGSMLVSNMVI